MPDQDIDRLTDGALADHAAALQSTSAKERAVRAEACTAAITELQQAELRRLDRERAAVIARCESARTAAAQRAEATRLEIGKALAAQAHDGIAPLARDWRDEPGRVATAELMRAWKELDRTAQEQLGVALGPHLLIGAFGDLVAEQYPPALTRLCAVDFGVAVAPAVTAAVGAWNRALVFSDLVAAHEALKALESALLAVARASLGQVVEPRHIEMQAVRRTVATRAEFVAAAQRIDEQHQQAEAARLAREYVAPPMTPPPLHIAISDRVRSWLGGDDLTR